MSRLALLLLIAACAFAEPNLSGTWNLDPAKSNFGPLGAPEKLVLKIEHKGESLRVSSEQKGGMAPGKTDYRYTTDGNECVNKLKSGELRSILRWKGDVLGVAHVLDYKGERVNMEDEWTVAAGGTQLTQIRRVKTPQGQMETTTVFTRQ